MARQRTKQLEYSQLQEKMLDEAGRRAKATKMLRVLEHFLGRRGLDGLLVADIGCSAGFIADELHRAGARTIGVDIDVPGLARAQERFGDGVSFLCADGERLPLADESIDIAVFNHIYEHVVDPDAVVAELRRVLRPDGVIYLGLGNRWGIMEPHYRLPFLSYLPRSLADRYVRAFGRADEYYERFRGRRGLVRMLRGFYLWDYTFSVIGDPQAFHASDTVPGFVSKVPAPLLKLARPIIPTFVWVGSKTPRAPLGPPVSPAPLPVLR